MHDSSRAGPLVVYVALVILALCTAGPASAKPTSELSLEVEARFARERKDDGSPRVMYRFTLVNRGADPIYVSTYAMNNLVLGTSLQLVKVSPPDAFSIQDSPVLYGRMRPPTKNDIVTIAPKSKRTIKDWQWSSSFSIRHPSKSEMVRTYIPRKPATIHLTFCYRGGHDSQLSALLPAGKSLWRGEICAKPVSVNMTSLPTESLLDP